MGLMISWHLLSRILRDNGLTISGGVDHVLHGGLLAFLADNLAAHLQSMFFALRIRKGCMITRELSQRCFFESDCVMHTAESHFEQCAFVNWPSFCASFYFITGCAST